MNGEREREQTGLVSVTSYDIMCLTIINIIYKYPLCFLVDVAFKMLVGSEVRDVLPSWSLNRFKL